MPDYLIDETSEEFKHIEALKEKLSELGGSKGMFIVDEDTIVDHKRLEKYVPEPIALNTTKEDIHSTLRNT
jgi:hypothetical protein